MISKTVVLLCNIIYIISHCLPLFQPQLLFYFWTEAWKIGLEMSLFLIKASKKGTQSSIALLLVKCRKIWDVVAFSDLWKGNRRKVVFLLFYKGLFLENWNYNTGQNSQNFWKYLEYLSWKQALEESVTFFPNTFPLKGNFLRMFSQQWRH